MKNIRFLMLGLLVLFFAFNHSYADGSITGGVRDDNISTATSATAWYLQLQRFLEPDESLEHGGLIRIL